MPFFWIGSHRFGGRHSSLRLGHQHHFAQGKINVKHGPEYTTCAKKNGSLWKIVDLFWLDQYKFIHSTFLTSLVFCTTPLRLNGGLHHPQYWFIQLVEAVVLGASLHLFANGQNYKDPFLPSQLLSMTLKSNKLHEIPKQFWILYNLSATAIL